MFLFTPAPLSAEPFSGFASEIRFGRTGHINRVFFAQSCAFFAQKSPQYLAGCEIAYNFLN